MQIKGESECKNNMVLSVAEFTLRYCSPIQAMGVQLGFLWCQRLSGKTLFWVFTTHQWLVLLSVFQFASPRSSSPSFLIFLVKVGGAMWKFFCTHFKMDKPMQHSGVAGNYRMTKTSRRRRWCPGHLCCLANSSVSQALTRVLNAVNATCWDTKIRRVKHGMTERSKQRCSRESLCCWPNFSIDWSAIFSKCYNCWGGWIWQKQQLDNGDICHQNHIQITSNGDTDEYGIHKCFSLGLSWQWISLQATEMIHWKSKVYAWAGQ